MPIAIFGSFGTALYYFTKVMTDYMLKKKMIEKGYVNEETQSIFRNYQQDDNSPLPYGLFAIFVSLGFLLYFVLMRRERK
jgi:hypothetical protein